MTATQSQIRDALEHLDSGDISWQMWLMENSDIIRHCLRSALDTQKPAGDEVDRDDDPAEAAYWRFDARRKGYKPYLHVGERAAFKQEYRNALTGDCGGGDLEGDTKKVIHLLDNGWKPVFNPPYEDTKYTLNKLPEGIISSAGFEKLSFEDAVTVQRCLEKVALTADNAKRGD